jgi:hypothetical protein
VAWRSAAVRVAPVRVAPHRLAPARRRRRWVWAVLLGISAATLLGVFWRTGFQTSPRNWTHDLIERIVGHRLSPAIPVTTSGSYQFMAAANGRPVTYNPCKTIRYELNLDQAPPGAEGTLGVAIQRIESASGLKFEYVGITDRRPLDKAPRIHVVGMAEDLPVVISWATPEEAPALAGNVAGYAGSSYITDASRPSHFTTGQVVLDSALFAQLLQTPDGSAQARAIVMHELGHLVGLAHVDDGRELMHHENVGQLEFGPGDRAGLAILGQGHC